MHLLKPEVTIYSHTLAARSYAKKVELAYPDPDAAIRDYLDQAVSDLREGQAMCWHLLRHLFCIVSKELTRLYRQTRQPTYTELARSWRRHMQEGQNRATIYDQVVKESRDSLVCQRFMIPHPSIHCSFYQLTYRLRRARDDGDLEEAKKSLTQLLETIERC